MSSAVPSFEAWLNTPRLPTAQHPANAAIHPNDSRLCKCCVLCTALKLVKSERIHWDLDVITNERGEKFIVGRQPEESCLNVLLCGRSQKELRAIARKCTDGCTQARHLAEQREDERLATQTDWAQWRAYHAALYAKLLDETVTLSNLFE